MDRTFINRAEAKELRHLYRELEKGTRRAAAALQTEPPGHILEGQSLARFAAADKEAAEIIKRIRAIQEKLTTLER